MDMDSLRSRFTSPDWPACRAPLGTRSAFTARTLASGCRAGVVRDAFAVPEGCARTRGPSRLFAIENEVAEGGVPRKQSRSARCGWRARQILPAHGLRRPT